MPCRVAYGDGIYIRSLTTENLRHLKKRSRKIGSGLKQLHELNHGFVHRRLGRCFFFFLGLRLRKELLVNLFCQRLTIFINNVAIYIGHHIGYCVTSIIL